MWALVVDLGEADDNCHLALAKHHIAASANEDALRVLVALTTLSPTNTLAWGLRIQVAALVDKPEAVAIARAEAAAAGATGVAFVTPSPAVGQG